MGRKNVAGLLALGMVLGGWSSAEAITLDFGGLINKEVFRTGYPGYLPPVFQSNNFSMRLDLPDTGLPSLILDVSPFDVIEPGCGTFESGCSNFHSEGKYVINPDGFYPSNFSINSDGYDFSIIMPSQGYASGHLDANLLGGHITAYINLQSAFRADNYAALELDLSVVPLPSSVSLFGAALFGLGALAWRGRLRGVR